MKPTMTLFGCGPKLALISLPYILLSLGVMYTYPEFLDLKFLDSSVIKLIGAAWGGLGMAFWIYSAVYFLKYFEPGRLIVKGPFALCRNPIYSSIIVFIIPSLGIIFHSGLILSIALTLFIGFKLSIHGEAGVLRKIFEGEYEKYEKSVNEIFPFPRYLLAGTRENRN